MKKPSLLLTMLCFSFTNIYAQLEECEMPSNEKRMINRVSKPALMDSTQLDSLIRSTMTANHIAGLSALITTKEDGIIWKRNYGYSNIALNQPVEDTTLFLLASVSKTIVATAIMQFWEADSFDLDDNINDYLDDFQVHIPYHYNDTVTFRMLMTHTSSIRDNWNVLDALAVCGDSPIPLDIFLKNYLAPGGLYYDAALNFVMAKPGTVFTYTQPGVCILAHLIEKFSGMPFDQYCREHIFDPLEMKKTSWFLKGLDTTAIATPYRWQGAQYVPYCHQGFPFYPVGQLRTNKIELEHLLSAYMNWGRYDGTAILDSSTVDLILTDQLGYPTPSMYGNYWGLIWSKMGEMNGRYPWGHGGRWWGSNTGMLFKKEEGWGVICFVNSEPDYSVIFSLLNLLSDYAQDITEVEEINAPVEEFYLEQNYPNPFNPSTTIRYGLPHKTTVQLTVFNTLGQQVAQLVNGDMEAGYHEFKFDGSKLASGVYLYRMVAGSYVETRKLLLVR